MKVGDIVRVVKICDESKLGSFVGRTGKIVSVNANGMTGNTEADPLYGVSFFGFGGSEFWGEELKVVPVKQAEGS